MTEYLPRSAWADSDWPRGGAQLTGTKLIGVADHWPGTTQDRIGDPGRAAIRDRIRSYYRFHVNTRGWSDIGYNFAGDQGGRVWDLRGLGRVGAHAASASNPDANHEWMGFLFIVGGDEEPSDKLIAAFQDWRHDVFLPRWPGRTRLTGHGRAPGVPGAQTSCPGPYVAGLITDGTLAKQSTDGDTMAWNENLNPTKTAASRFPEGYSTRAEHVIMHILGLTYHLNWGKIRFNSWMQKRWGDQSLSPRVLLRSGYGHAREGKERVRDQVLPLLREIRAAQGSDERDQVLADIQAELQAAQAERQSIGDRLDVVTDLLEQVATGDLSAEQLVEALRQMLHQVTAPDDETD